VHADNDMGIYDFVSCSKKEARVFSSLDEAMAVFVGMKSDFIDFYLEGDGIAVGIECVGDVSD